MVERTGLAGLIRRRGVILPEPRGSIAVAQQDSGGGCFVFGELAVVAGEPVGVFAERTEADRVVVAPGDERRATRRTQSNGVEVRIAEARLCDTVQGGRRNDVSVVDGAPKPTSSVRMSRMFGAPFGGTTRAGHAGFDWVALRLMTPWNGGGGGGR